MSDWLWRRVERRLLRALPADTGPATVGDLCEEYRQRLAAAGRIRAAIWLSAEARSLRRSYRATGRDGVAIGLTRSLADWPVAARALKRRPGFAVAAILMLGVGLGAASASWSIFDRVLVRPLPYPHADRLQYLSCLLPGEHEPGASLSFREARDIAERVSAFDAVAAFWNTPDLQTQTPSGPMAVVSNFVQGRYFEILGARPVRGRLIGPDDDGAPGANPVVVISESFWRDRLGADEAVLGSTLPLNGKPFTVIGVMAADFRDVPFENGSEQGGGQPIDVWLPGSMLELGFSAEAPTSRRVRLGNAVGRLKPGVTEDAARAELTTLAETMSREFPDTNQRMGYWSGSLAGFLYRPIRRPLVVVLTASIVLLMVGALNVGGLLLVRQQQRRRELVVRRALGASLQRLMSLSIMESLVLVGAALIPAMPISAGILAVVRRTAPLAFPRLQTAAFDGATVVALVALGALAAVLVSLVSMSVVWRLGANAKPSATRSVTMDRGAVRLQRAMVVGEVALSAALLVSSALVVVSFVRLSHADPGFDADRLIAMELSLRADRYREDAAVTSFSRRVIEEAASVPGAESVALWGPGRPGRDTWVSFPVTEANAGDPDPDRVMVWRHNISPGALATAGIPLVSGREFLTTDTATRPFVAVISQSMARRFWGDEDPVGKRFSVVTTANPRPWFTVVGVAADASHRGRQNMLALPQFDFYQLLDQRTERTLTLLVRSSAPEAVVPGIRDVVRRIDPDLALRNITTLDQHLRSESAGLRFASLLLGAYAALAFVLSAFGVYALISYVVTMRAREWAMRQVLGATSASLIRRLVSNGAAMGVAGIGLGLVAAWWSGALLQSVLFGIGARSLAAYGGTAVVVLAVTVLAAAIPARRAARISPAEVLQSE